MTHLDSPLGAGPNLCFRSGMSSKSDLRGAINAFAPVGVVAGALTTAQILMTLPRYLDAGGSVFVDSGAFTAARTHTAPLWEDVLRDYEALASMTDRPSGLFVVAPDKVGDQAATLALLQTHCARLCSLVEAGVNLVVPLQCGELPAATMLSAVKDLLGPRVVAGIPSNKAAMPIADCQTLNHYAFHVLGRVQPDDEQQARIRALRACNPQAFVSADANWLRSRLALISKLTERERHQAAGLVPSDHPRARAIESAIYLDQGWGGTPPPLPT